MDHLTLRRCREGGDFEKEIPQAYQKASYTRRLPKKIHALLEYQKSMLHGNNIIHTCKHVPKKKLLAERFKKRIMPIRNNNNNNNNNNNKVLI